VPSAAECLFWQAVSFGAERKGKALVLRGLTASEDRTLLAHIAGLPSAEGGVIEMPDPKRWPIAGQRERAEMA